MDGASTCNIIYNVCFIRASESESERESDRERERERARERERENFFLSFKRLLKESWVVG